MIIKFITYFVSLLLLILTSCSNEPTSEPDSKRPDLSNQPTAIIIVVENNQIIDPALEMAFTYIKDDVIEVFSDIFSVPISEMQNKTLNQIIEIHGENWMINELNELAKKYYQEVIILTDGDATGNNLLIKMKEMKDKGYYIDLLFSIHAGKDKYLTFSDRRYHISEITHFINYNHINIRAFYQTCCYGSYFFNDWNSTGITSINGSLEKNDITMFSPIYFLEEWINGSTFNTAVSTAYTREIEKLKTYNQILPINEFFLTEQILKDSKQSVSGFYPYLKINEYFKEFSN